MVLFLWFIWIYLDRMALMYQLLQPETLVEELEKEKLNTNLCFAERFHQKKCYLCIHFER